MGRAGEGRGGEGKGRKVVNEARGPHGVFRLVETLGVLMEGLRVQIRVARGCRGGWDESMAAS